MKIELLKKSIGLKSKAVDIDNMKDLCTFCIWGVGI